MSVRIVDNLSELGGIVPRKEAGPLNLGVEKLYVRLGERGWAVFDPVFVKEEKWVEHFGMVVCRLFTKYVATNIVVKDRGTLFLRRDQVQKMLCDRYPPKVVDLQKRVETLWIRRGIGQVFTQRRITPSPQEHVTFQSRVERVVEERSPSPLPKFPEGMQAIGWYSEKGIFVSGGALLGRGTFRTVASASWVSRESPDVTDVAMSCIEMPEPRLIRNYPYLNPLAQERLVAEIGSPYLIAESHDVFESADGRFVYTANKKYFSTANRYELETKLRRSLTQREKVELALEAAEGIKALHDHGYLHRDIKDENIFIEKGSNGSLHAVVGDLGFVGPEGDPARCGTRDFAPPELAKEGWTKSGDLYSFGVVLIGLFRPEGDSQFIRVRWSTGDEQNVPNTRWLGVSPEDEPMRLLLMRLVWNPLGCRGTIDNVIEDLEEIALALYAE